MSDDPKKESSLGIRIGAAVDNIFQAWAVNTETNANEKKWQRRARIAIQVLYFVVLLLALFLLRLAITRTPEHSFLELLLAEIFGGLATFIIFLVLQVAFDDTGDKTHEKWHALTNWLALLGALGFGYLAYRNEGVDRDLLLEISVGSVLAVILENWVKDDILVRGRHIAQLAKREKTERTFVRVFKRPLFPLRSGIGHPGIKQAAEMLEEAKKRLPRPNANGS